MTCDTCGKDIPEEDEIALATPDVDTFAFCSWDCLIRFAQHEADAITVGRPT